MTVNESEVACQECGQPLLASVMYADPHPPCPACGAVSLLVKVTMAETIEVHDSMKFDACEDGKSRKKGRFAWGHVKRDWFHREGVWANVSRQFNKREDTYEEVITYEDSGEVIRKVRERLSEHRGRGSAKPPREPEA